MQHVAPLAPLLLIAAFVASIGAPAAAPSAATTSSAANTQGDGPAAPDGPTAADAPAREADAGRGLSAAGRWIVLLRAGSSVNGAETRARRLGVDVDRTFRNVVRGYSARLSDAQVATLREDPTVEAVVPDAVITLEAQSTPRGVRRVFATQNPISRIDGIDQRVDADVAIVDTGIDKEHGGPQRGRRGELLELEPGGMGRRQRARHPRRRHRRRHRQRQRRGRRRARRAAVGGADPELGRQRPRVVVRLRPRLDHRPARPSRLEPPAHRGRQHVGREDGQGRPQLRAVQQRPDAPGRVPARRFGRHRGGRRRQQPLQRRAPRARRLQRGDHRLGARGQRRPPGRPSAARRATRGAATTRTTRSRTSPTSAPTSTSSPPASASSRPCPAATDSSRGPRWPRRT